MNLAIRHGGEMPAVLKGKLTALKSEKLKFYNNEADRKYLNEDAVRQTEMLLFGEILNNRIQQITNHIKQLEDFLSPKPDLFGGTTISQTKGNPTVIRTEIDALQVDLENARQALHALQSARNVPFVWDIAFVEVFQDDKNGFDIVIGNPPYVRQEKIRDPLLPLDIASTPEAKKAYKAKLARSIYMRWPRTFMDER